MYVFNSCELIFAKIHLCKSSNAPKKCLVKVYSRQEKSNSIELSEKKILSIMSFNLFDWDQQESHYG
jgi:hypothetical protein